MLMIVTFLPESLQFMSDYEDSNLTLAGSHYQKDIGILVDKKLSFSHLSSNGAEQKATDWGYTHVCWMGTLNGRIGSLPHQSLSTSRKEGQGSLSQRFTRPKIPAL